MEAVASTPAATGAALLPLAVIRESKTNPRRIFDQGALDELTDSVKRLGVLQPILVRQVAGETKKGDVFEFEIVSGHRRYRAAKAAGLIAIPVVERQLSDLEVLEIQLVENLQRTDLHALEEAEGYDALMRKGYDVNRLASQIGRSVKYVYDRVKLLQLTHEAADLFRDNRITAGHAVILARLTPEQQAKAIEGDGLWRHERALFRDDDEEEKGEKGDPYHGMAPVSVRELQGWVDRCCRFDRQQVDPMLFPETAARLAEAKATTLHERRTKVIPITYDHVVGQEARAEERTYGNSAWRRADGKPDQDVMGKKRPSDPCEFKVLGVVVAGPGRGEAFDVCIRRDKCEVHWGKELKEKAKAAKGGTSKTDQQDRWKKEEEKQKAQQAAAEVARKRFNKAMPAILKAVAEAVRKAPATASGWLATILVDAVTPYGGVPKAAKDLIPLGSSAEDVLRHAGFILLLCETGQWDAAARFSKHAKQLGIDVAAILDEHAPEPKAEAPAKAKKPTPKKKAAKK